MTEKVDYYRELEAVMKFSQERYTPSFVQSYGWFESSEAIFIAMEYVPHGDLQNYLSSPMPEDEARIITRQLAEGLHHMHMNGFTHRDLKPENILVVSRAPDWLVQISDFGIIGRLRPDQSTLGTMRRGTLGFIAPEMLGFIADRTHPYAVDIWSLGAAVFTMVTKTLFMTDFGLLQNLAMLLEKLDDKLSKIVQYFTHLQNADDRGTIQDLTDGGERLVIKVQMFLQAWQSMMTHEDGFEAKESWEGYLLESGAMKHLGTEKLRSRVETLEQSLRVWVLRYDAYSSEKVKHVKSKKRAGRI
ncbi:calcium/calmodulin-dependent protein kinase type 1B [Colletotrichum gloeosporioides Cg-14]|uniref:Calcium/calmodulin-dependent protein kinase type 1B n=1 Tax=Colletotrichum gloeosporioides (strain Cg-14) TaxID=1237896 RepID=T0KIB8_COLGC|nr:calcium/calmodulin-dependent protein kinase type 1B [Colletotrichum gloeosporioides Cg-14]